MKGRRANGFASARAATTFMPRGRHLFVYDVLGVSLAIVGAFALRFDTSDLVGTIRPFLPVVLLPIAIQPVVNIAFGLYRREWRFASVRDLVGITAAVAASAAITFSLLLILGAFHVTGTAGLPRSFIPLGSLLSLLLLGGGRLAVRVWWDANGSWTPADADLNRMASLVYGAGEAGAAFVRFAGHDPAMGVRIVGFLDDDPKKRGSRLNGIKIYGGLDELGKAARATHARELIVAMPSAPGSVIRQAVDDGRATGLQVRVMPHFHELFGRPDDVARIRPVSLEDLLRREAVRVDIEGLADYLNGATVLVTGGGGSIGSELARQILTLGPRQLVVADNNEAALWRIERDLVERPGTAHQTVKAVLCDVRSAASVERLLGTIEPDVVFHAAALKHVPICELQPAEAVLTNVVGTKNLLGAAAAAGVSRFVMISTDKAVKPVSVMGATKRLAEILTLTAGQQVGRPHIAVRFGNVLGSSGSVVPIFQHQLERGLPITITHPDATRFFMTIPEAVSLILQAGASETVGDVFILDMGDPVRIVDLAADMIRLSGVDPSKVEIVYTGLRPGERLEERLFYDHESMEATVHARVWRATSTSTGQIRRPIDEFLPELAEAAAAADDRRVRQILTRSGALHAQPEHAVPDAPLAAGGAR
jgi:FlaA1/EpsC-like NDP-sugar epimerase